MKFNLLQAPHNFQETRSSIIKDGAVLEPGGVAALAGSSVAGPPDTERSGLLRGSEVGPRDGRPVIHTDSD